MKTIQILSRNLKHLRKQQSISQEEMSLRTGIARSYMSGIECQRINPTIRILDKLAKALNVSSFDLLAPLNVGKK